MLFPVGHTNSAYDLSGYADSSEGRKADFFFRIVLPDRLSWLMERAIGIVMDEHINGRKETKEKAAGQK